MCVFDNECGTIRPAAASEDFGTIDLFTFVFLCWRGFHKKEGRIEASRHSHRYVFHISFEQWLRGVDVVVLCLQNHRSSAYF